ncbi:hypothetical protein P8C59_006204 [Phyllachora maydis]|uniref:Reverse transcriptase Ty1/copia-type domain-containing protein n=1 Tax=Phyllachora maydis TaxID=1825666 RepID=A0AAD9I5V1_9PEZI|nr:hypothetical protein P8C59_006204 [Phyllachora maydis]
MADQAKGKGIAPKRASNPADPGQSSRPLLPIQTLSEDKEDSKDYSKVIEVLKQCIKSHKRVIASQSSDIKTLLLSLNTLKASVEDSVSAIKNISSTLASLTNSSNTAATRKTSYSPRFDPFSGTIDLDSPPRPPRKEPHLGPAIDNTATSNLDPPIDTGSKEGFKDTITSSIVKELSKKAYTIPDDRISNFLENPDISNTYSDSDQAVLLMLLRNSLSSSPRAAISRPIESKKEDVYNEFHALTFSTYKKGLSAFNAEFNGYLAELTIAKIDIDPSLILNQQARMLGLIASSLNIEYLMADILEESRNPAIEAYRAAYVANSSNSTPNSNSNPSKKGKNKKKGKKKASYNVEGQNYSTKSAEQASFILGSYNLAIEEEEEKSDSSSNSSSSSDSDTQLVQLLALKGYKKRKDFKGKGLKTSSNNKAKYKDNKPRRRPRDPALYNSQLRPINTGNGPVSPAGIGSIILEVLSRKAPPTYTKLVLDNVLYLPNIDINIVSGVRYYDSGGCLIKDTLYRGDRRCIAVLDFKKSGFFLDVKGSSKPILHANFAFPLGLTSYNTTKSIEPQRKKDSEDAIVSEAIEPNKRYKLRNSPAKGTTLEGIGPSLRGKRPCRPPTNNTALEGELVDLDLDLEGAVSLDPSNLNTEKPISIEIGPSKLEPYESSSDKPIFAPKPIEVIAPNQPIKNEPLNNSDLISEGYKMQLDYYKLLAKTSSYILSFVYKARKRVISKDSMPTTYKQVLKLPRDERSKWLEAITKEFIYIPPTWRILLAIGAVLDWEIEQADFIGAFLNSALREEIYMEIPEGLLDLAASNKAIYKLLLKYGYNPSTPNIIKLSKALYGVFYNAKTCHFIVTYIDDCLFIRPNIGYITDLKKRLNKVYAIEDLGPAAYFLGVQIIRDRPNRRL